MIFMNTPLVLTNDEKHLSNCNDENSHSLWNFENLKDWNKPLSVDLTTRFIDTTENQIRKEYQKFVNRLSKSVFQNSYKRFGLLINETGYLEYGVINQQPHIHTLIETPKKIDQTRFKELIREFWTLGTLRIRNINEGDTKYDYNTKMRTKNKRVEGKIVTESLILVTKY